MKPAPFALHTPGSVEEALGLLAEYGAEAKPLAGGQSLVPAMNFRLARPAVLVDLNRVDSLAGVREVAEGLVVGAMTRQRSAERSPRVRKMAPLLAAALEQVAHPQIRNRGTVGGSLAHADPAAELPAAALALRAELRLRGPAGERRVPAEAFFQGPFFTALEPDELLVAVEIPAPPPRAGWGFHEVARRAGDFALAGAAAWLVLDSDGRCREARLTLFGVGPVPVDAAAAAALVGEPPDAARLAEAARVAAAGIDPPGDVHAGPGLRRQLAAVVARRALEDGARRAARTAPERPEGGR